MVYHDLKGERLFLEDSYMTGIFASCNNKLQRVLTMCTRFLGEAPPELGRLTLLTNLELGAGCMYSATNEHFMPG